MTINIPEWVLSIITYSAIALVAFLALFGIYMLYVFKDWNNYK